MGENSREKLVKTYLYNHKKSKKEQARQTAPRIDRSEGRSLTNVSLLMMTTAMSAGAGSSAAAIDLRDIVLLHHIYFSTGVRVPCQRFRVLVEWRRTAAPPPSDTLEDPLGFLPFDSARSYKGQRGEPNDLSVHGG